ncbi:hypothetical protein BgiBS90_018837 [Biomphalaria glabrata]|nr:hypothetical protein BgiBS90_018837 [Biomphalaria glabrata]
MFFQLEIVYMTVTMVNLMAGFAENVQVYLEEMKQVEFYCPPITFSSLNVYYNINATENRIFSCSNTDYNKCKNSIGNVVVFNSTGCYFPFNESLIEVKRTIREITCVFINTTSTEPNRYNYSDEIAFIAIPQNLSCLDAQLINNDANISIICITSKVYPEAHCMFNASNRVRGQVSSTYMKYLADNVEYYQSKCEWTSSINSFQAGNYALTLSFFPSVTNNTQFSSSITTFFQFTLPNVSLSSKCFNGPNIVNGFIRPGATANCICYLNGISFPPAVLKWSNSSNSNLGTSLNDSAISLTVEPFNDNVIFTCTGSSNLLNGDVSTSYTATYASGPKACSVELNDTTQTIFKMCRKNFINLTVLCQVNITDVVPAGIKAEIYINLENSNLLDSQNMSNFYLVKHEINITKAGNYSIKCQAKNTKFNDYSTTCFHTPGIQVIAPPETPPKIQIFSTLDGIQENKVYFMECKANGGIPPISNITLSCGNNSHLTETGYILTSPVTFTRNMTNQNCTCTAQHITGCYDNNVDTLQLNILYRSSVLFINVSSSIVDNGKYTQLNCAADGNPPPKMYIFKGDEIIAQNLSGYFLFYNKSMFCKDAGNYICHANNGIDLNYEEVKQITIFVKCPLQFAVEENFKNFNLHQGKSFSYNFTVYGYPGPDKFTVIKSSEDTNKIKVTSSSKEPPYIIINLNISNLTYTDFDNYTLIISQPGSQNLTFHFSINEANETDYSVILDDRYTEAAIGGGIGAGFVFIFTVIILVFICRKGKPLRTCYLDNYKLYESCTIDTDNSDIYTVIAKRIEILKKAKENESETYKNYKDIVPTITSATAVPKNMYKPEVKPKPKISNTTEYYNFVEPLIWSGHDSSDTEELVDESAYANQGFNAN